MTFHASKFLLCVGSVTIEQMSGLKNFKGTEQLNSRFLFGGGGLLFLGSNFFI